MGGPIGPIGCAEAVDAGQNGAPAMITIMAVTAKRLIGVRLLAPDSWLFMIHIGARAATKKRRRTFRTTAYACSFKIFAAVPPRIIFFSSGLRPSASTTWTGRS